VTNHKKAPNNDKHVALVTKLQDEEFQTISFGPFFFISQT